METVRRSRPVPVSEHCVVGLTHQLGLLSQYLCKWRNYELDPTDWSSYEDLAETTALDAWEKEHPPPQGAGKPPPPLQPEPAPKKGEACPPLAVQLQICIRLSRRPPLSSAPAPLLWFCWGYGTGMASRLLPCVFEGHFPLQPLVTG
jgi:hypothetical protein